MISQQLIEASKKGIIAIRTRVGVSTLDIFASECAFMTLDAETGGVWYQMNPDKVAVPVTKAIIYAAPFSLILISFNS